MSFWVYMPRWMDDSFYVGHTDNLETRVAHHQTGDYPSYALKRRPVVLVYSQEFTSREEALSPERQIKSWSRAKKQALIDGNWRRIQHLAWGVKNPLPERLR